ncbi:hypothetical protein DL769_010053 [Monosporascus sp. CRB-8-3]|nr:hypothetical protein DL769_010053 [Monosporascus sp. CRB-8-3]
MAPVVASVLLWATILCPALGHVTREQLHYRAETPRLPYDPNTSKYCSYWFDYTDSRVQCDQVPQQWGISMADFLRWNPSITSDCGNFTFGRSYCVEVTGEPSPTTSAPPETTSPPNGIQTPQPIQDGMVDNCDAFYFVPKGSGCDAIATAHGITPAQFLAWNPMVGSSCGGLWADVYVCVSVIGHTPTTTTPPTTTRPPNGITTPTPTQPDIVDNCDAFYFVPSGEGCAVVARKNGITLDQFLAWNRGAGGESCSGLWGNAYACVSVIGHTPTPPNGVQTPTPIQDGMVTNCMTFHFVLENQTCATIANQYKISQSDFIKWNPAVGKDCQGLWAKTYACVGLL